MTGFELAYYTRSIFPEQAYTEHFLAIHVEGTTFIESNHCNSLLPGKTVPTYAQTVKLCLLGAESEPGHFEISSFLELLQNSPGQG